MRVATKSVSRDGDIRGKYLFARPRGAAYMKGPPPDRKKKKLPYLSSKMMKMAPYPGMQRYDAYASHMQRPSTYVPPPVELPDEIKDEPVVFDTPSPSQEVTYPAQPTIEEPNPVVEMETQTGPIIEEIPNDGTPGVGPTSVEEIGERVSTFGRVAGAVGNVVDTGLSMVRRTNDVVNVIGSYANRMIPYVGYLVNTDQLTAEGGLQMLFGTNANPIIAFIRKNMETRRWVTNLLSQNAIRPAAQAVGETARAGGNAVIRYFLDNPAAVASESLNSALANPGNLITAGAEFIPTPTIDEVTRTVVEAGAASGSNSGMINAIMQVLTMLALRAGIQPPPRTFQRLAGTVAGPVSFRGPYALRPRDPVTGVVQRAIMDNVARPIQGALVRRVGQRLQPPT